MTKRTKNALQWLHDLFQDGVLDAMVNGRVIWANCQTPRSSALPINLATGEPFGVNPKTGLPSIFAIQNALHLAQVCHKEGFDHNVWVSESQLDKLGGWHIPGEKQKAFIVNFFNISNRENGAYFREKCYKVWNLAQTAGLKPEVYKLGRGGAKFTSFVPALADSMALDIQVGDTSYNREADILTIPDASSFKVKSDYEAMLCRGLILATSHKDRMDREFTDKVFETLVCELGTFWLMARNGYVKSTQNADMLKAWQAALEKRQSILMEACKVASKAVKYILSDSETREDSVKPVKATGTFTF